MQNYLSYFVTPRAATFPQLISCMLASLLLAFTLSCGSSSHLESIQVTTTAPQGFDVVNLGGTIQLTVTGIYSDGHTGNLTEKSTYAITITQGSVDQYSNVLPTPPQGLEVSSTGLVTAEYPPICTWTNLAVSSSTAPPIWELSGSYTITATDDNITSPPVYVAVASQPGIIDMSNPNGLCGPQPSAQ